MHASLGIFMVAVLAIGTVIHGQIDCPMCSDQYNPDSCNGTQTCTNSHDACRNHQSHPCSQTNHEMCSYCCTSFDECQEQREDLFNNTYTTYEPPTTVVTTAGPTVTTAGPTVTTAGPTVTTAGPTVSTTPDQQITSTTSAPMTTTTRDPNAPVIQCFHCGDFDSSVPCTTAELYSGQYTACPTDGYCFVNYFKSGGGFHQIKGCVDANFCREQYALTATKPECNPINYGDPNVACTWCCNRSGCNLNTPPPSGSLVTSFP